MAARRRVGPTTTPASQPFHLRAGASGALADGWAFGTVGPFGSEVFTLPVGTQRVRLDLPQPAMADLSAGSASVSLTKTSREPSATLSVPQHKPDVLELRGAAGQPYKLQALAIPATAAVTRPGTYWVSAVTQGTGGDEVPPSVLLERSESAGKPPRIVASVMPSVSSTVAWRGQFNLRGAVTMLFQNTGGGVVGLRAAGVDTRAGPGREYDLPADYYTLDLAPAAGKQGVVDLTVGATGATPSPTPPLPPNPVLPLGVQTVAPGQSLFLSTGQGPGVAIGLSARRVPVALAEGPLAVTLVAGQSLAVPVAVAPGGTLFVAEGGGGPVPYTQDTGSVMLLPADRPRTVVLAWHRNAAPPADIPAPPPRGAETALAAGQPVFLDLAANERRSFALSVPDGGVYRVETLGRLHTSGSLATAFIPVLGQADGNGLGQNMLIQSVLRAGRYRVEISAQGSAGHLGVLAATAPLLAGATLVPGGSVRATLPAGSGASFPITVAAASQRYHLDVASLGRPWTGRIEDADGWPLTKPGPLDGAELALPSQARLVIEPDAVTRQVVARLRPMLPAVELAGHGPHPLAFDAPGHLVWREPAGADQPRTPDAWSFALEGPAEVMLMLSGGMVGSLHQDGSAPVIKRVVGQALLTLQAGHYRLDTTSEGRNDRLAYSVTLASQALQPGHPRTVTLPATIPFAIAETRPVSLSSFGTVPLKGVLRQAGGGVMARLGPRADDWNIALSQPLPAGAYMLELAAAAPPSLTPRAAAGNDSDANPSSDGDDAPSAATDSPSADDRQAPQTPATQAVIQPKPANAPDTDADTNVAPSATTELRLALPATMPAEAASAALTLLPGTGVHVLPLPQPQPGDLVVAQARSSVATAVSLERQDADGWLVVALETGLSPLVASPADAGPQAWRAETWTVDGGPEGIQFQARALAAPAQGPGMVSLARLDEGIAAAHVRLPQPGPAAITGAAPGLLAGGWPGHALTTVQGAVMPQGADIWLLARAPGDVSLAPMILAPGQPAILALLPSLATPLPARPAASGQFALWRAASGLGLPGLGAEMGVAAGSTLAPADHPTVLRNAFDEDGLRVRLTRLTPTLASARPLESTWQTVVPPDTAIPLTLPQGDKQLRVDVAPGLALITDWRGTGRATVWTGDAPVSTTLGGGWTELLLVNTGEAAAPASLSWQPAPAMAALQPGSLLKRFFGAAGSFEVAAQPGHGSHLVAAGHAMLTAILEDGRVRRGQDVPLEAPARVVVDVQPGVMALWEAGEGASPWPSPSPQAAMLPSRVALSGPAMALGWQQDAPALLHARTTAPVLLGLGQTTPELFEAGADYNRLLPAGAAELRLYAPDDGPLSGTLALSAEPVTPISEGLGAPVSVAPGGAAVWGFTLAKPGQVGVGVQAQPDRAAIRVLDDAGHVRGEGVAQLLSLPAGAYALEARVPPDAPTTVLRPAIVGITPPGNGPPPDVVQDYLELAGLKPQEKAP